MPTMVYTYRLLTPPTEDPRVRDQLNKARDYHRALIVLERERRAEVEAVLAESPALTELTNKVNALRTALDTERDAVKASRSASRTRQQATREQRARITQIRTELAALSPAVREARVNSRAAAAERLEAISAATHLKTKEARAASGLYWGTYLRIEAAVDAAKRKPGDLRWPNNRSGGALAVQCQNGLPVDQLDSDRRVRLVKDPTERPRSQGHERWIFRLRIGSEARDPVWAEWPVLVDRYLPLEAKISWVVVLRTMIANREQWRVQFTLVMPEGWRAEPCGKGIVAVDLGWRVREDDSLRVGYWRGFDGVAHEILTPPRLADRIKKADSLRAIRDRNLDAFRPWLANWLREHPTRPEWLTQAAETLPYWRAPARFAALANQWHENRFEGDKEAFIQLDGWRKQDVHLWTWEVNQRRKALAYRLDHYRCIGAELGRKYETVVLENLDLRTFATTQAPEDGAATTETPYQRLRALAAPSELRGALKLAFERRGGRVLLAPAAGTTKQCHACGHIEEWDAGAELWHTCGACGTQWDQDDNAARNLLAWGAEEVARIEQAAPAPEQDPVPGPRGGRWARRKAVRAAAQATA
jgi:hypothetical protein